MYMPQNTPEFPKNSILTQLWQNFLKPQCFWKSILYRCTLLWHNFDNWPESVKWKMTMVWGGKKKPCGGESGVLTHTNLRRKKGGRQSCDHLHPKQFTEVAIAATSVDAADLCHIVILIKLLRSGDTILLYIIGLNLFLIAGCFKPSKGLCLR